MNKNDQEKVVNFAEAKRRKVIEEELSKGRTPLYLSHLNGKVTGSPHLNKKRGSNDFNARIERIKSSLERINKLMKKLRETPQEK